MLGWSDSSFVVFFEFQANLVRDLILQNSNVEVWDSSCRRVSRQMIINYEKSKGVPAIDELGQMAVELETRFKIKDLIITVERVSPRLRSVPKQLRLDFEKAQTFELAVLSITPKEGQILISAKIPA
jgi:hypothetical protein